MPGSAPNSLNITGIFHAAATPNSQWNQSGIGKRKRVTVKANAISLDAALTRRASVLGVSRGSRRPVSWIEAHATCRTGLAARDRLGLALSCICLIMRLRVLIYKLSMEISVRWLSLVLAHNVLISISPWPRVFGGGVQDSSLNLRWFNAGARIWLNLRCTPKAATAPWIPYAYQPGIKLAGVGLELDGYENQGVEVVMQSDINTLLLAGKTAEHFKDTRRRFTILKPSGINSVAATGPGRISEVECEVTRRTKDGDKDGDSESEPVRSLDVVAFGYGASMRQQERQQAESGSVALPALKKLKISPSREYEETPKGDPKYQPAR
ncbi:hypothetical protein C8R44DRAFT_749449 [Mycena epipterygia]|nr:hypothetical protein C8R44DRAFT_749449 [Mycena epipterygia]